jgi:hypothetical protein
VKSGTIREIFWHLPVLSPLLPVVSHFSFVSTWKRSHFSLWFQNSGSPASLSPIWRGFAPGFVNYKKGCTRLAVASDKVYQLLAHGRWFSAGTAASSTTKTCRHDIAEILLKVALNTKKIKSFGIHWVDTFTKCSKKW